VICPLFILPVNGLEGEFGPLRHGAWLFTILQRSEPPRPPVSYVFQVADAPMVLTIEAGTNSTSLLISWPFSGDTFLLESNDALLSPAWQAVTNSRVTSSNRLTVQIDTALDARFFRLRRQ
jgi:hypothetical protein